MEYRQNQWDTNGTSSDDNAEKEKARGNIGLPLDTSMWTKKAMQILS